MNFQFSPEEEKFKEEGGSFLSVRRRGGSSSQKGVGLRVRLWPKLLEDFEKDRRKGLALSHLA